MSARDRARVAMRESSDAELVAASGSDASAFGLIFDRHVEPIYRYVVRRVGTSLAEDLTAETFARAYAQRERFVSLNESARPWLYGIATNLIHNARRAEQRQLSAYGKAATTAPVTSDDFEQAVARLDAGSAAARLIPAVIQLEPGDRDALLLFAWQELTYKEVGIALDIPTGTVASRISRARRLIRATSGVSGDDSMGVVGHE